MSKTEEPSEIPDSLEPEAETETEMKDKEKGKGKRALLGEYL
jgi:hypothetical protein